MEIKDQLYFMNQALIEGRRALPNCIPNPPVGCVIVKDGVILARGHTSKPGGLHAEAMALSLLPSDANDFSIFVTLEPCSFYGRTPSCARTITTFEVKDIYVGILDPHFKNQGAGISILLDAEIDVHIGIMEEQIQKELSSYLLSDKE